jgi:hypothetical protein
MPFLFAVQRAAEAPPRKRELPTLATSEPVMPLSDTLPANCRLSSDGIAVVRCAVGGLVCARHELRVDRGDWKCEMALTWAGSTMA